jgi:antitoxin ParD1/3/4
MEEQKSRMDALRKHLAEGEEQANNGDFIEDFSMGGLIAELDQE